VDFFSQPFTSYQQGICEPLAAGSNRSILIASHGQYEAPVIARQCVRTPSASRVVFDVARGRKDQRPDRLRKSAEGIIMAGCQRHALQAAPVAGYSAPRSAVTIKSVDLTRRFYRRIQYRGSSSRSG
jgi:hypothetical protein